MENRVTPWPVLKFDDLKETIATVHLWTQIVGKIRLKKMPWLNHSWHVTLYVSPRGLTTGSVPYENGIFQIEMDFISHEVILTTSEGARQTMRLYPRSVADFYGEIFKKLREIGVEVDIYAVPNELDPAVPFAKDEMHKSYDAIQINLLWQALVKIDKVLTQFRSGFTGKVSPVHFFWGAFDLAVTRFSGRTAPEHPGGAPNMPDRVMQEAYSHEVSSSGFWPGSEQSPIPAFYSYCYPTPENFKKQPVLPKEAFYSKEMGEFLLTYEAVQKSDNPEKTLMEFLTSTYSAAAVTGQWDKALECDLTYLKQ
jgi:hypothetical protein